MRGHILHKVKAEKRRGGVPYSAHCSCCLWEWFVDAPDGTLDPSEVERDARQYHAEHARGST